MIRRSPANSITKQLMFLIFALLLIGIIVISSSTSIYSQQLYGNPFQFTLLQLGWIIIGLTGFFFFYKFDYKEIGKLSYVLFVGNVAFLAILALLGFLPCESSVGFAPCINGANRWLYLNPPPLPSIPFIGVLGFQPGELAKLSVVLYLSVQLAKNIKRREDTFTVYAMISGILGLLILLQPNMSTSIIVMALGTIIYFASDSPLKNLLKAAPLVLLLGVGLVLLSPYRKDRLISLLGKDDAVSSYHKNQILISLGSGGWTGVGFGNSMQKFHYLPEIASDSIFAIIGEEFGIVGTVVIVSSFIYFMYLGYTIGIKSEDTLAKLLSVGVTSWIALQFFINSAAMTGLIPLTGVPIPLISYGGSSMVFSLAGLGILANISRTI